MAKQTGRSGRGGKKSSTVRGQSKSRQGQSTAVRAKAGSKSGNRPGARRGRVSMVTSDHDEIRRWAESRGAQPACVRDTGGRGDIGMIRLDFPGYSGEGSLEPISWDDWFRKFDESNLALVYEEKTAKGERSNFNKLIGRETAQKRQEGVSRASRRHPEKAKTSRGRKAA